MRSPNQQSLDKHAVQKGDRQNPALRSTSREDREIGFENGGHHRICLEILPQPCNFGDLSPRKKIVLFFQL